MFCKKCGAEMADTDKVCASCGAPVEETPVETAPTPAPAAAKAQIDPLRLSAVICQSVGALFMMLFCFQIMSAFSDMGFLFDLAGVGFISPLVSLLMICAAAAAVFVPVCLWLQFAGKLNSANAKLADQGNKLLPISILVQLIVESVLYGLLLLCLLIVVGNSDARSVMSMVGASNNMVMAILGVIIMAASVIFLHAVTLKLTKGGAPNMTAAIACFVAGGVHVVSLLFLMDGAVTFLLLAGYAAADIIYGIITMNASKQ